MKPSLIAATSLLFAINISLSKVAPSIKTIKHIDEKKIQSLIYEAGAQANLLGHPINGKLSKCPFRHWTESVTKLTGISITADVQRLYNELVGLLDENWYDN